MYETKLSLPNLNMVYAFHKEISKIPCDVDLMSTNYNYVVDAKSIMGILSMDLTSPVILKAHTDNPEIGKRILEVIDNL